MLLLVALTRRLAAVVCVIALATALVACGDDPDVSNSAPSDIRTAANGDVFNQTDVDFATHMIPHHAQAIEMVTLADGRPLDPDVEQLANQVRDAQVPEVETMTDWLTAWGEEVPETSLDHSNAGHDTSMDGDLPGMMSAEDMDALQKASDEGFQELWLEMMVEHHQGAIEMATTELSAGRFPDALSLAESIKTSQQAEIQELEQVLMEGGS